MELTVLLAVPPLIGTYAASIRFERQKTDFEGGCGFLFFFRWTCVDVVSEEKILSQGFVVDASEKYISLYENGKSITLPLTEKTRVRQYSAQISSYRSNLSFYFTVNT